MNDTVFGVFAYTLAADRTVRDRTHFARLPVEGLHNGLAVDAEGGVWVAASGGGSVVRFGPDGVVDEVIAVPAQSVMSLEFGGPDHQDLYVVCSDNQVDPDHAGTVFRARTEVPGLPGHRSRLGSGG
jgi:sugar lactone lactonase YvrE